MNIHSIHAEIAAFGHKGFWGSWHTRTIELWGPRWAICRATQKNLTRYQRCLTKREYYSALASHIEQLKAPFGQQLT
jgi:hypothetical protein